MLRTKSIVFKGFLFLAVLGILLLAFNYIHNSKYDWNPVRFPIRIEAGQSLTANFVAELDQFYELELAFYPNLPQKDLYELVIASSNPSPIDMTWKVLAGNQIVAHGNCKEYLYVMKNMDPLPHKILRRIFNIPYYQAQKSVDSIGRGFGRFRAESGKRYEVHAEVQNTMKKLDVTEPIFNVRVNRIFSIRHYKSMLPFAVAGLTCIGISGVLLCLWMALVRFKHG